MDVEERKIKIKDALIISFVDDYKSYKSTMKIINKDFKKFKIDYQYVYDDFCVEFLNQTLESMEEVDIFNVNEFENFYINFLQFSSYNIKMMIKKKLNYLGYDFEDFKPKKNKKNV